MAASTPGKILEQLQLENEEAVVFDDYRKCLIGICYQYGRPPVACYDHDRCIAQLMTKDKMTRQEALEFFEFNALGSGLGENTPVFIKLFT